MEHLKDTEKFIVYKKDENLVEYIWKLVSWIERFVFNRISKRVNFLLDRSNDSHIELIKPGNTGSNQSGNVRLTFNSNNDIIMQYYSGTSWVDTGFIWDVTP